MNTVDISIAREQFCDEIKPGEYVAWWNLDGHSIVAVARSYPTVEVCELAAVLAAILDSPGLCERSKLDVCLVIDE